MAQKPEQKAEYPQAGLSLPQGSTIENSIFQQPAAFTGWMNELPLANPLECAKILFKGLFDMNRTNLDIDLRIKALEEILKPVESVAANLKGKYVNTVFPLSEKNRKIALLIRELYLEIAIGYKTVVAEQLDTGSVTSRQNIHIIAAHRIATFVNKVLIQSYLTYEPYPENIWRELHLLFTYSSINKIDRIPVVDATRKTAASSTIKQVYINSLLLSAASPYQLRQREIESLNNSLELLGKLASLSIRHVRDNENDIGFLVNLHSDSPPVPLAYAPKPESRQMFVLDTRQLLDKIQQSLSQTDQDDTATLNSNLKKTLLKNWGHAPHRQYVRTKLNFDLQIAIGLNEIHTLIHVDDESPQAQSIQLKLSDTASPPPGDKLHRSSSFIQEDDNEEVSILTLGKYDNNELNRDSFLSSQKIENNLLVNGNELLEKKTGETINKTHTCKTINESSGGYCIEWPKNNAARIRVGEVIGIQSVKQADDFGLAITRWLKNMSEKTLMVGIEIISHNCAAVQVRLDRSIAKNKPVTYYPGLIIPQTADLPAFMITPSDLFETGNTLRVKDQYKNEKKVKLSRLTESTGLFSRYEITDLPPPANATDSQLTDEPSLLG